MWIFITKILYSFIHDALTNISNEETFLQLQLLQNLEDMLYYMDLVTTRTVMLSACSNIQSHTSVLVDHTSVILLVMKWLSYFACVNSTPLSEREIFTKTSIQLIVLGLLYFTCNREIVLHDFIRSIFVILYWQVWIKFWYSF